MFQKQSPAVEGALVALLGRLTASVVEPKISLSSETALVVVGFLFGIGVLSPPGKFLKHIDQEK